MTGPSEVFRNDLLCFVQSLTYDFVAREGILYIEDRNCTNMPACVDLFRGIDPLVQRIVTMAGERRDVVYVRRGDEWEALARLPLPLPPP